MAVFTVSKDANIGYLIEVEAETEQEAIEKVQDAWSNNPTFVKNYLEAAEIYDENTYIADSRWYSESMTLDDMCCE